MTTRGVAWGGTAVVPRSEKKKNIFSSISDYSTFLNLIINLIMFPIFIFDLQILLKLELHAQS